MSPRIVAVVMDSPLARISRILLAGILACQLLPGAAVVNVVFKSEFGFDYLENDQAWVIDSYDDAAGDITLRFGNTLGQHINFNVAEDWFEFNNDVNLDQHQLKNAAMDNRASAPSSPVQGQMYHNTTDNITYAWSGYVWKDIHLSNTDTGTTSNTFTINNDDTAGDMSLIFGDTLNKSLKWDVTNSRFAFNDAVRIEGNLGVVGGAYIADDHTAANSNGTLHLGRTGSAWNTINFDVADDRFEMSKGLEVLGNTQVSGNSNVNGSLSIGGNTQVGDAATDVTTFPSRIGSDFIPDGDLQYSLGNAENRWNYIYVDQIATGAGNNINFGEAGISFTFSNAQTTLVGGRTSTIEIGDLVKINTTGAEEVLLTTAQNQPPIGIAANSSNFGEELEVVVIGKTHANCTGSIAPGSLVQTSPTTGYVQEGGSSTKVIGTAISGCNSGKVLLVVHLM